MAKESVKAAVTAGKPLHARLMETAYELVSRITPGTAVAEEYLHLTRQLPALLHSGGLLQTVSFLRRKETEEAARLVLNHLRELLGVSGVEVSDWDDWRGISLPSYLRLKRYSFWSAEWLKRYSEILLSERSEASGRPGGNGKGGRET